MSEQVVLAEASHTRGDAMATDFTWTAEMVEWTYKGMVNAQRLRDAVLRAMDAANEHAVRCERAGDASMKEWWDASAINWANTAFRLNRVIEHRYVLCRSGRPEGKKGRG